ncbi:hypothetical protein ACTXT7_003454 [Hymenolepis weldensis]
MSHTEHTSLYYTTMYKRMQQHMAHFNWLAKFPRAGSQRTAVRYTRTHAKCTMKADPVFSLDNFVMLASNVESRPQRKDSIEISKINICLRQMN